MSSMITRAALTALLLTVSVFARDHSRLNGTWTLIPTKSDFAGQPVIQTGTVTINEREGNITVSRRFTYKGATETFFYNDLADSENNATIRTGDIKTKAKWDHDVLKVINTTPSGITTESYRLDADGTMTANVIRPGREPLTLVFERK